MTKREIAALASAKSGITQKTILDCMNPILESILEALSREDKILIQNFGTFYVAKRSERKSRNPSTGEAITVPAKKVIKFKLSAQRSDIL
jgi:DNA-binding protein HU-beta